MVACGPTQQVLDLQKQGESLLGLTSQRRPQIDDRKKPGLILD